MTGAVVGSVVGPGDRVETGEGDMLAAADAVALSEGSALDVAWGVPAGAEGIHAANRIGRRTTAR